MAMLNNQRVIDITNKDYRTNKDGNTIEIHDVCFYKKPCLRRVFLCLCRESAVVTIKQSTKTGPGRYVGMCYVAPLEETTV